MTDSADEPGPSGALAKILRKLELPRTARGRAQRAIFRLIAGGVGLPYFEHIRENLDTVEGRSRVNAMVAEEVGRQAIADPELMERAKARFLGDLAQKQVNVEAVALAAQAKLEEAEASQPSEESSDEPTDDWMNAFSREAENASSEELRRRLADLLAGEVRKPGTFSRSTIRLVAELDREVLIGFQSVMDHLVADRIVREESWGGGVWFATGVMLEDAGLISGSSGFTHHQMKLDFNGNGFLVGKKSGIVAQGPAGVEKQIGVWLLTRSGREIAELMPTTDEEPALRRAIELIDKDQLTRIMLGRVTRGSDDQVTVAYDECAWSASGSTGLAFENLSSPSDNSLLNFGI